MSAILGIDPGLSGALCLQKEGELQIADMPIFQIGKKRVIDAYGLAQLVDSWGPISLAYLEFVASSPQMGVVSAFKFGEGYGVVRGVLAANFIRVETVTPASWKRAMRVTGDKDECRAEATRLFPRYASWFARKKDDGRAEAVLLAQYGVREATRAAA